MSKILPLAAEKANLGGQYRLDDGRVFEVVYASAAVDKGKPYIINHGVPEAGIAGPTSLAPATSTVPRRVGIATETLAAAGYTIFQVRGPCRIATVTKSASIDAGGEHLEVINAGVTLIYESDARGVGSVAVAGEIFTGSGTGTPLIYLIGEPIQVAAT